ncbi:MAG: DNA recombination protein RmuC, partial [bacterium]|nr:DNA recombination protein RmuC [bacterium]
NTSNKIFEDKREKFLEQNKSNLNTIISPLKDQLKDFKEKVENIYDKETRDRVSLQKEIFSLKELNIQISKDALNLTNALKGDHKTQGSWGEIILEKVLEESGLRNGHEYVTQFSTKDDEGKIKRPDAIVHLPDNKDVIVDSKLSLKNYEKYVSEENLQNKENYLKQFILNIKNHIKELSEKKYEDLEEIRSLDYVLMFIPIEGAFMTFLEYDRTLFSSAFQKNIVLVSPATLLVVLKTIQTIWRYEYQNRNSKDIADRAEKLYDKFCGFIDSLQNIGKHINKAELEYQNALKQLSTGRGNIVTQIENIKKLGLKTRKNIPKDIIQQNMKIN